MVYVNRNQIKKDKFYSGLFLLALTFSWLGQLIISVFTSSNLIEIFLIPGLFLIIKSSKQIKYAIRDVVCSKKFNFSLSLILIASIISIFKVDEDQISYIYADFRSNLSFIFFLFLFFSAKWNNDVKSYFFISLLIIVSLFDVITLFLREPLGQVFTKQNVSICIPAFLTIHYFLKNRFLVTSLFYVIMSFEAIVGFYRNYYLIVILVSVAIVYLMIRNLGRNKVALKNKLKSFSLILVIILSATYSVTRITNYWLSDGSKMIHSINRTQELMTGENSESERINSFLVVLEKPFEFIIPNGIGWRAYIKIITLEFKEYSIISTMDSTFFYFSYHYGIIIFMFFIITIVRLFSKYNLINKRNQITPFLIRMVYLLIFVISFFTQGIMLTLLPATFAFSILLANSINPLKI